jgi:hypothetical protein
MDSGYSFEDADYLLKRDWFLSPEDIDDLLWSLYEEVYQEVYAVRHTYSRRIQDVFYHYEPRPRSKVKELTYEMMEEVWAQEDDQRARKLAESLKNFVYIPNRSDIDDIHDRLQADLSRIRQQLPKFSKRPTYYKSEIEMMLKIEEELKDVSKKISERNKLDHELQWIENGFGILK